MKKTDDREHGPRKYDGLTAADYLEREFLKDEKPHDCTCGYPEAKVRNGIGHRDDCPSWWRIAPAYYDKKGYDCGTDEDGRLVLKKRNSVAQEPTSESAIYDAVVERIVNGTATAADFDNLIEATDKSTKERVHRRTRQDGNGPTQPSMAGRVVPKKTGRNDPPNQGRGRRYASGTAAKERQNAQQRRRMAAKLSEALAAVIANNGCDAAALVSAADCDTLQDIRTSVSALLRSADAQSTISGIIGETVDADWLYDIVLATDQRLLVEGVVLGDARPVTLIVERAAGRKQEKGTDDDASDKKGAVDKHGNETRDYSITGKPEQLNNLEMLFKWIEFCGSAGHSASASLFVDGDGRARLKFDGVTAEMPETTGRDPEIKVGLD